MRPTRAAIGLGIVTVFLVIALGLAFDWKLHRAETAHAYSDGDGKSMFFDQIDSELEVAPSGALTVTERLSYDLGGTWHGLYRDIYLAHGEEVNGVRVYRESGSIALPLGPGSGIKLGVGGAYGTYGYGIVKDPTRALRIVWNVNDSGPVTYIVRYRLANAVANHTDASSLLWNVWGSGTKAGVQRFNVNVRYPQSINTFHARAGEYQKRLHGQVVRGGNAAFNVQELPGHNHIQIQLLADRLRAAGEVRSEKTPIIPKAKAEQAAFEVDVADKEKTDKRLQDVPAWGWCLLALLGIIPGLVAVYFFWRIAGRETSEFVPAGDTYIYPPEKVPAPVVVQALPGQSATGSKMISSSILSMLKRDVFRVLPSDTSAEDIGIANNVGATRYDATLLEPYEVPIADMLQAAIDAHPHHSPEFLKLKDYVSDGSMQVAVSDYLKLVKKELPKYQLARPRWGWPWRVVGFGIGIIGFFFALDVLFSYEPSISQQYSATVFSLVAFGFAMTVLAAAIEGNAFNRLDPETALRLRAWQTYADFFKKMDMSREYPMTIDIWDEALIYAAAFGQAKKVVSNMKVLDADGQVATGSSNLGFFAAAGSADAFSSFSSGITTVSASADSSGSGGGGGGGGGSGGGGAGGW